MQGLEENKLFITRQSTTLLGNLPFSQSTTSGVGGDAVVPLYTPSLCQLLYYHRIAPVLHCV